MLYKAETKAISFHENLQKKRLKSDIINIIIVIIIIFIVVISKTCYSLQADVSVQTPSSVNGCKFQKEILATATLKKKNQNQAK